MWLNPGTFCCRWPILFYHILTEFVGVEDQEYNDRQKNDIACEVVERGNYHPYHHFDDGINTLILAIEPRQGFVGF